MLTRSPWTLALLLAAPALLGAELPLPKEGVLIPKRHAAEMRAQILAMPENKVLAGLRKDADQAVAEWPAARPEIERHAAELLDVLFEGNPKSVVPAEALPAARQLAHFLGGCSAKLGFLYFLTGEQQYADTAYEILELSGRVPRWGWFNWEGSNMPQIHYGMYARSAAFCVDFCWNGWDKARQERAATILAERVVEPYWRLVSLPPFMAFHHLRSRNQGNNALGGALVGALVLGDSVPDARLWFGSLFQTYSWIIAHDIGWAGTNLESGLPGYWDVSMSNLYTAAACLYNARGIDVRAHSGFAEATWYPVMKEATVPFAGAPFDKPYPKTDGLSGIIQHKPIELPSEGYGGPWWYDYAAHFPASPAAYFINRQFGRVSNPHQEGHFELMDLLWVQTMAKPERPPVPTVLFKATDREACFRSGYGSPHTFLSFAGDLFLSARHEVLGCTSGLAWHFPWHQYAVTESAIETEGQPYSPSMQITGAFDSAVASMISTKSGTSDVKYYPIPAQGSSYRAYKERTRDVLYVRSDRRDQVGDYFVFIDRLAHDGAKWHSFNWHLWNHPGNEGRYEILDERTVLARRPNASLLLASLSHERMGVEQFGIPSQPTTRYSFDHDAQELRWFAGGFEPVQEAPRLLAASAWPAGEPVEIEGHAARHFADFKKLTPSFTAPLTLTPGVRYRLSVSAKKKDAWVDENLLWTLDVTLLDAHGNAIRVLNGKEREPDPQRLTDPSSGTAGTTGWREAATCFDAPVGVAAARASLRFAQYSNNGPGITAKSELWLGDVTIAAEGRPQRSERELLVTLAMPLETEAPRPQITATRTAAGVEARIVHPDGTQDHLVIGESGAVEFDRAGQGEREAFGWQTSRLALGGFTATQPAQAAFLERSGALTGNVTLERPAEVTIAGKAQTLEAGAYRFDGSFQLNAEAASLKTNSAASQQALKAGLSSVAAGILAERDEYTSKGWRNIALEAEASATGTRDPRFDVRHIIDNQTWEIPIDGVLDYTLGPLETTGNGGYGKGATSYTENPSSWLLYVRPTYWLLPPRQPGAVTLKLKQPAKLRLVRLLDTTNGGLNDYAAVDFRLDLLNEAGAVIWSKKGSFGQAYDHAFQSAFAKPEFFKAYGVTFQGLLEPGVKVPFGAGWQNIPIDLPDEVHSVRVTIESSWALGGGLNEIQVYP